MRLLAAHRSVGLWLAVLLILSAPARVTLAQGKQWIRFADKGEYPASGALEPGSSAEAIAKARLSPRALARRAKSLPLDALVDAADLPIDAAYLDSLRAIGVRILAVSNWENAVSAELTAAQRAAVVALPFVSSVAPVARTRALTPQSMSTTAPHLRAATRTLSAELDTAVRALRYGLSWYQLDQIQIPAMHALGVSGHDVLMGVLDVGFRWRVHPALRGAAVVAEHDYVFNDDTVANQANDVWNADQHGTGTFSCIAGNDPDSLVGGSPDAQFILAKTEDVRSETHAEEDNYAAALEWMEGLGVDVTSSSLGYFIFDSGQASYSYADMNGRTTIVARAAARASSLGVAVVTAAGNEGGAAWHYIISPADADRVIAVGAVALNDTIAGFSSRGPTSDGRIKPEICADGVFVRCATLQDSIPYSYWSGTSLATPIAASAVALLLSCHPELNNNGVRSALLTTASQSSFPDTNYGWGIVRILDAALSVGPVLSNPPRIDQGPGRARAVAGAKARGAGIADTSVAIFFSTDERSTWTRLPLAREGSSDLFTAEFPPIVRGTFVEYYLTARPIGGAERRSPYTAPAKLFSFISSDTTTISAVPPVAVLTEGAIVRTWPSPVSALLSIEAPPAFVGSAELTLYDPLGRTIRTLYQGLAHNLPAVVTADLHDLPSGIYSVRYAADGRTSVRTVVHVMD